MSSSLTRTKVESGGDKANPAGPQTQRVGKKSHQQRGHTPGNEQLRSAGPLPRAPHTVRTSSTAAASTRRSKLNNFMSNQNTHPNAPASQTLAASTSQKATTTLLGKKQKVPAYM